MCFYGTGHILLEESVDLQKEEKAEVEQAPPFDTFIGLQS